MKNRLLPPRRNGVAPGDIHAGDTAAATPAKSAGAADGGRKIATLDRIGAAGNNCN